MMARVVAGRVAPVAVRAVPLVAALPVAAHQAAALVVMAARERAKVAASILLLTDN